MPYFFACLSPEEIGASLKIGSYAAAFAGLITLTLLVLNWYRRDFRWLPIYGVLLLVHPAWSVGAYGGDCGYGKRFLSVAISAVFMAVLLCELFRRHTRIRWFLLILAGFCWIAYGASQLYWQLVGQTWLIGFLSRVLSPAVLEAFLFASPTLLNVALVVSSLSAILYGLSWNRTRQRQKASLGE